MDFVCCCGFSRVCGLNLSGDSFFQKKILGFGEEAEESGENGWWWSVGLEVV